MDTSKALNLQLRYHPWRVFTYLLILGISSAFLTITLCLVYTFFEHPIPVFNLPVIFHTNTAIILASSYSIYQVKYALRNDDHEQLRTHLLVTTVLGVLFTIFQFIGWFELQKADVRFITNITGTYFYLLSGLHLLHLLVGVFWILYLAYQSWSMKSDAYRELLFETNPVAKLKIEMAVTYWHFVDLLWVYLYFFLLLILNYHLLSNFR